MKGGNGRYNDNAAGGLRILSDSKGIQLADGYGNDDNDNEGVSGACHGQVAD